MAILSQVTPHYIDELVFEVGISTPHDLAVFDWEKLASIVELPHFSKLQILRFTGPSESKIGEVAVWIQSKLPGCVARGILEVK